MYIPLPVFWALFHQQVRHVNLLLLKKNEQMKKQR